MRLRHAVLCGLVILANLAGSQTSRAQSTAEPLEIDVPETIWGFDGKGVRETFTPLSILIQNTGTKSASGTLRLSRQVPLDSAREPALDIPFDVPAFEERWVQAAPYLVDEFTPWQLTWGPKPSQRIELPQPRLGEPAVILLVNPNDRPTSSGVLRRFKSNLFPASITATDSLQAVFLNSVPDIQGARLQTFLEWLHRGGCVVLLHDGNQQFPNFPSPLAVLNDPRESFQVGAGQVRRLPREPRDVSEQELRRSATRNVKAPVNRDTAVAFDDPYKTYNGGYPWTRDRAVLEKLEAVSRFHRRWWIIYPLCLLYLLAVFPGTYAVAHSSKGVRGFYIAYFLTAIGFSWAFTALGGVGGGDENRIRSATIAHQLSPGVFDCTQWSSLAAVSGGMYSLSHEGSGRLYAPCEEFEVPRGQITAGAEARYEVDIPVASTRTAVSRFRATGAPVNVQLRSLDLIEGKLSNCAVTFEGLSAEPLEAYVCHRDRILRLKKFRDTWGSDQRRSMATSIFITNLDQIPHYGLSVRGKPTLPNAVSNDFYRSLERTLVGNAFQARALVKPAFATLPEGCVRVMALVEDEKSFSPRADGFNDVQGCVLYVADLPFSDN